MFFIPGFVISYLTFPGVIVHEAAHLFFCRMFKLAVFDVAFFTKGGNGYVVHERTTSFTATFFVAMGPFFVNTALCILFCLVAFIPVWELQVPDPLAYFFYWLGLSIGMHAFPSTTDLTHVWQQGKEEAKKLNWLAILSYPVVAILYPLNFLRVVWADLGYGIAVGVLVPLAIFKALV